MKNKEKTIFLVTLVNAIINLLLAVIKIIIGKIGFSQALVADGLHSFSDLITDALVYIAARASIQHPDKEHPYGHGRIETIASIVIGLILLGVAIIICDEAAVRLLHHAFDKPTIPVVIVAVISIIANEVLFHYSRFHGKKIQSNLLINNAWHKRSDVFVSIIVLLSVIGSLLGIDWLDAVGAIVIALFIVNMAIKMIWQSGQELIDRGVDEKTLAEIRKTIISSPGVKAIHELRTRLHGNMIFLDLHIIVDSFISVSEGHHIGDQVHAALLKNVKKIKDVVLHVDPEDDEKSRPSFHLPNRQQLEESLRSHWQSLPGYNAIQKTTLHYLNGELHIEIYMAEQAVKQVSHADILRDYRKSLESIPAVTQLVIYYVPE